MDLKESGNVVIYGTTISGEVIEFQKILSYYWDSDRYTPVDSLEFSVLDELGTQTIVSVTMKIDGAVVFDGSVDTQIRYIGSQGRYLSFSCRSKACLMVDNEVRPYWYFNLTSDQLIQSHALPYGANGANLPYLATLPQILAQKGISHWEFIELFCQQAYHQLPYLDRDGKICCTPFGEVTHLFSNRERGCFPYERAEIKIDRYQMISKLYIKTGKNDYGATYSRVITNSLAQQYGIVRERYYHPEREWENNAMLSGENMICEKQRGYFEITLYVPGIHNIRVGDCAKVDDEHGWYTNLYVSQVRQSCDSSGCVTKLKLWNCSTAN
jgi:hypothetical protein